MDRQQAAVHYVSQAELALKSVLDWCSSTYGAQHADQLSRMFGDILFGQNLTVYCDIGEVLSLWTTISRRAISEKVYGGEFIVMLHSQFSMYVEPAVIAHSQDLKALTNLTPLGSHLVSTIARAHPLAALPAGKFNEDLASYMGFFEDVPKPDQVIAILSAFPWMAVLYLLAFSQPITLKTVLQSYQLGQGAANLTGA